MSTIKSILSIIFYVIYGAVHFQFTQFSCDDCENMCTLSHYHHQIGSRNHYPLLTHWGRVTHICFGNLTIIGSDNGLAPGRRQTIIWTNDGLLLIGPLGTNFSEILIGIQTFSFKKMHLKMSSAKWRPFCLGLNVLRVRSWNNDTHCMSC